MTPAQKQLELRLKVTADVADAQRNLQQLATAAQQTHGRAAGPQGFGGYVPPPGFGAPGQPPAPAAGGAVPRPGPFTSAVPAFDRPVPVVIVGPKPLHVTGTGGAGAGPGGGAGGKSAGDKEKERHEALLTSLRNLQLGGTVGRYEQIKGFGEAAGKLGLPGGALLGRLAGPAAIALGALQVAGDAGEILSDEYTTGEQKGRAAVRKFVPFGETIQSSIDGLTGRKAGMERAEVDYQKQMAEVSARAEKASFDLGYRPEQAGYEARETLLARATPILEGASDRTTAAGEKAFRDRQRLLPIEREEAKLQREAAVATAQRASAEAALGDIQAKRAEAARREQQKGRELGGDGRPLLPTAVSLLAFGPVTHALLGGRGTYDANQSGVSRQRTLYEQAAAGAEAQQLGELEKQARRAVVEARRREAETGRSAGQARVQRLQAEADILDGDASQAASGAQSLGGMDRFSRANAVRSLQLLQQFGPERMSPRELAEARAVAPQTVAKILEQAGKQTPQFDALRALAPADYAGDPEELRRKAQEKRDEAAQKELDLDRTLATKVAAAGRDLGKYIGDIIDQIADEIKKGIDRDKRIGRGASS
ncbi:Outer membrane protein (OmpH-like) [Gemmata obscuriglobus]|uniref:Uncharacterized protein n=1 Tax=Gemmata obscuriglobus TaxID=114 RepID=A0A2Z3GZW1_9BACT|nr:hypothetical protein [Gemmata obscuriglobus]AWM38131.1 hypothetical protein C1280_14765 [Gemmata obscuriglobus]QEG28987.1 Outer membrane protein (OmpH-like) [Gemmata obscuriglobus]VTS07549.1 unnamed protein product [Gemmata obscuriglobus UQM 2246]